MENKNIQKYIATGLSGAFAASLSTILFYPLENLRIRMGLVKQQQFNLKGEDSSKQKNYSLWKQIKIVWQQEGLQGFYQGLSPLLLANLISYGVYFFWYLSNLQFIFKRYEFIRIKLKVNPKHFLKNSFVCTLAGAIATIMTAPLWTINVKTISTKASIYKTIKTMINTQGYKSFFYGLSSSLLLTLNPVLSFAIYSYFKSRFSKFKYQVLIYFISGALSKMIASTTTFPYQVLRSNMQNKDSALVTNWDMIKIIYSQKGMSGFYSGLQAKLMQSFLNSAHFMLFYEKFQELFEKIIVQ